MKPKLKPRKGWLIRLILCDSEGNIIYDDFSHPGHIVSTIHLYINKLLEKAEKHEAELMQ